MKFLPNPYVLGFDILMGAAKASYLGYLVTFYHSTVSILLVQAAPLSLLALYFLSQYNRAIVPKD
jgi:hypothetical protein